MAEAVRSALSQTFRDHEVIVINDGSTDSTADVLEQFGNMIRLVSQENRGLAGARNRALEESSGELVALLDADDEWLPNRLEQMVQFMDQHPSIGFATSDAFLINAGRSNTTYYSSQPARHRFRHTDQGYWITRYNFIFVMAVIRRALIQKHGAFDESLRSCEDWDLWARFILGGEQAGLVDEPLALYRKRPGSLSEDLTRMWSEERRVLEHAHSIASDSVAGLVGNLEFAKAKEAWSRRRWQDASSHFKKAAGGKGVSVSRRILSGAAAVAPRAVWQLYIRTSSPGRAARRRSISQ